MNLLIQNARVIDPYQRIDEQRDWYVIDGVLRQAFDGEVDRVIDASGCLMIPGMIDAHVHFRDPGLTYKEDIVTGTKAAAKGGFTIVAPMPNTKPVCDTPETVRYMIDKAESEGYCRVIPYAAASMNEAGDVLVDFKAMKEAGAGHITDDGMPVKTAGLMRRAMEEGHKYDMIVSDHCEDKSLTEGGLMNESVTSKELGVKGVPSVAEDINAARDILLAEYLDIPVHISHVSTKRTIELVRDAKARGLKVTSEVCPHHFTLTDKCLEGKDANYRMYPPLRGEADKKACIDGLFDGTIDFIATDHAPHAADEKSDFATAMNGILGLETSFALGYKILHEEHGMDLMQLVSLYTSKPAEFFALDIPGIQDGAKGDFALIRIDTPYTFDKDKMASKSGNTPFHGWEFNAEPIFTMWQGRITYDKQ